MAMKMAIIGFGGMGFYHYENVSKRIDGIDVTGVWDIRPEMREKAEANGLHAYGSLDELLADQSIGLVTIATPNNFHKDLAIACMESGKNVICEKPVTMNADELREIIAVRDRTGKVFSVHQNRRWDRDYAIVREIIRSGRLGKPYYIESRVQGSRRSCDGWRGHKVNGGGMVYDWGIHLADQLLDLFEEPVIDVYAQLYSIHNEEVDDNFKLMLKFENGVTAMIEIATNCFINQPRWHVTCVDGTAVVEDWSCKGRQVKIADDSKMAWADEIVYTEAGPTRTMAPRPPETTEVIDLPEVNVDWCDYYKNIAAAIEGREELIVKPEQALRVMQVIDLTFRSAAEGRSIACRI